MSNTFLLHLIYRPSKLYLCYNLITHSIFPCINLIITKNQLKSQYSELTWCWYLTVWLYQKEFSFLFRRLIISCSKFVSSAHYVHQMNKERRFDVLLQLHRFTIISLMLFPLFLKVSIIIKDLWTHLCIVKCKNIANPRTLTILPGQFHSTNKSGL